MIQIHNKSTYQRIYNCISTVFIDSYCGCRCRGHTSQESLQAAKISVQAYVAEEIQRNRPNRRILVKAYDNLKNDSKIIEKAINYYQSMK